ncbi:MAG: hypothetical protein FWC11_03165 [Firmicutes bacterium]|nr:hypothetical protein [Bacillota bacterium]
MPQFKNTKEFWKWFDSIRTSESYHIINKKRFDNAISAINTIFALISESNPNRTAISLKQDDLLGTALDIEIITDVAIIDDLETFCNALRKADVYETCSLTNGKHSIGISFEDVFDFAPPTNSPFPEYEKGHGEPVLVKKLK